MSLTRAFNKKKGKCKWRKLYKSTNYYVIFTNNISHRSLWFYITMFFSFLFFLLFLFFLFSFSLFIFFTFFSLMSSKHLRAIWDSSFLCMSNFSFTFFLQHHLFPLISYFQTMIKITLGRSSIVQWPMKKKRVRKGQWGNIEWANKTRLEWHTVTLSHWFKTMWNWNQHWYKPKDHVKRVKHI